MNKHLAKDLERYADMLAEGELISPDDLNCSAIMRLAAEALAQPEQEPVSFDSEMKAQAKRAYPHDAKRELAFIDGWLSREATQQQNSAATDWAAVHDKLMDVWHRELSADEGFDEIQGLINTTPPQRKPLTDKQKCVECFAYGGHHRLGCIKAAHGIKE